jgi:hypothetical protein
MIRPIEAPIPARVNQVNHVYGNQEYDQWSHLPAERRLEKANQIMTQKLSEKLGLFSLE